MCGSEDSQTAADRRKQTPFGGWRIHTVEEDVEHHLLPEDDLREHALNEDCWCGPARDEEMDALHIHNSLDGREMFERGERRVS